MKEIDQRIVKPLDKCVLRCDKYLNLIIGGTYGYVRNNGKKFHGGIDLYAEEGTKCYAIGKGRVVWTNPALGDYGKAVLIKLEGTEWKVWALYAHLSDVYVKANSPLEPYTPIGLTGTTGNGDSRYPHLHFEIWSSLKAGSKGTREKYRIDPLIVLGPLPFSPFAEEVIENYLHNA